MKTVPPTDGEAQTTPSATVSLKAFTFVFELCARVTPVLPAFGRSTPRPYAKFHQIGIILF